jgi:hypothetical protein
MLALSQPLQKFEYHTARNPPGPDRSLFTIGAAKKMMITLSRGLSTFVT